MKSQKPILDACCGSRMFHFNKKNPLVEFVDIRKEKFFASDGRVIDVNPDTVADFRDLPHGDESFHLVIFDPPHLRGAGKNGWMAQKYGSLGPSWRDDLKRGFDECFRVLKKNGTLIFKWNEESIKVSELIDLFGVEPMIGHRTRQSSKTVWLTFFKGDL